MGERWSCKAGEDAEGEWVVIPNLCCRGYVGLKMNTPSGQIITSNQTEALKELLDTVFKTGISESVPQPILYSFEQVSATVATAKAQVLVVRGSKGVREGLHLPVSRQGVTPLQCELLEHPWCFKSSGLFAANNPERLSLERH